MARFIHSNEKLVIITSAALIIQISAFGTEQLELLIDLQDGAIHS